MRVVELGRDVMKCSQMGSIERGVGAEKTVALEHLREGLFCKAGTFRVKFLEVSIFTRVKHPAAVLHLL